MSILVLIFLNVYPSPPVEARVEIQLPSTEQCEAMRHQYDFATPVGSENQIYIGSYCEAG
jgi:ABC-type dipeptide/oligopeptide/nickel transport system permease component